MTLTVLAVNVGSSSLRCALWRQHDAQPLCRLAAHGIGGPEARLIVDDTAVVGDAADHAAAFESLIGHLDVRPDRVGHRFVRPDGASRPCLLDDTLLRALDAAVPLAPLHLPPALAVLRAARRSYALPHVVVDDSAFHADLPPHARTLAVPPSWRAAGVHRCGYHGLASAEVVDRLGSSLRRRCVHLHLGAGCSATAIADGRSAGTSMGLTPTGGLVMATRSGDLDPGTLIHIKRQLALADDVIEHALNRSSGLRGMSGTTGDMQELLARRGDEDAALAVEVFCRRAAEACAARAIDLGGCEQVVFTGGIGEHAEPVRQRIGELLAWMGVRIDPLANQRHAVVISPAASEIECRVLSIDETRAIARSTIALPIPADGPQGSG